MKKPAKGKISKHFSLHPEFVEWIQERARKELLTDSQVIQRLILNEMGRLVSLKNGETKMAGVSEAQAKNR